MPSTTFRKLIEQAMFEVRDEFAEIVSRKLAELLGDAEPRSSRAGASTHNLRAPTRARLPPREAPEAAPSPRQSGKAASKGPSRRNRTPASKMSELRDRVLGALDRREAMKKSQILERAGLDESDETRLSAVLRKLKDEGLIVMQGTKASATYLRAD